MAVCPSCYTFLDETSERCPRCNQSIEGDAALGDGLLAAAGQLERESPGRKPRGGFRPTLLLAFIAGMPLSFGLWRFAFGAEIVQGWALGFAVLSIVGGIGLGGLALMFARERRGFLDSDAFCWWVAGGGPALACAVVGTSRLLAPSANLALSSTFFFGIVVLLNCFGAGTFLATRGKDRSLLAAAGPWICLAWCLIPLGILLYSWSGQF